MTINSDAMTTTVQTGGLENARVLIVDDNEDLLKLISIRLKPMKLNLKTATSAEEALSLLALWNADLVVTDLQMQGMSGLELFDILHEQNPLLPVIILTAHGTIPEAVEATQSGVASYLTKPFDSDALVQQIQLALRAKGQSNWPATATPTTSNRIVYQSPLMKSVMEQIDRLAATNSLIVFEGETGTGKTELARALHGASPRADKPLLQLSCASLPSDLLDAELFGQAGSDTQSRSPQKGLMQKANGGTLLLCDLDEAPPALLKRVFTAMHQGTAKPLNSNANFVVDVRGIATSLSPTSEISNDETLWNLGAKLDIATIAVPPLHERREDIPLIIAHWLKRIGGDSEFQFSNKALHLMLTADWPGNVRQLVNVVKQCVNLTKTRIISESLVQSRIHSRSLQIKPLSNAQRDFERDYLIELLKVTNGNVTKAAAMAKRNRTEFHRLLNKHKIEAKAFRQST